MKIAIVGCGAAGSVFASFLRKGGCDLTLVDPYAQHMDAVKESGMSFTIAPDEHYTVTGFKTAHSAAEVVDENGENIKMDGVIFVTKATVLRKAIEGAKPIIGENTVLISLINGIGNDDILCEYTTPDHVIFGSGVFGTFLNRPGACTASPGKEQYKMNFGPSVHSEFTDGVGQYLEECFCAGGCPAKYWDDVRPMVWKKATDNCIFNPLTAMMRLKSKYLYDLEDGWPLIVGLASEVIAVANAKGIKMSLEDYLQYQWDRRDAPIKNYYCSMAQDMLFHERQTEIHTLNGVIARYGKELGIPTPYNEMISHMVALTEKNYEHLFPKERD